MKIGPSGGGIRGTFQLCIPWFMSCPGQRKMVPITDTLAWNSPCSHEAAGSANELESCLAISPWGTALNLQRAFVTMSRASHFSDLQAQKTCLELVMISKPQSINFQSVMEIMESIWRSQVYGAPNTPIPPTLTPSSANYLRQQPQKGQRLCREASEFMSTSGLIDPHRLLLWVRTRKGPSILLQQGWKPTHSPVGHATEGTNRGHSGFRGSLLS